jgi:hypothetical protein
VQLKPIQRTPALLAVAILLCVCVVRLLRLNFLTEVEGITYDLRARTALNFSTPIATNLALVVIEDSSVKAVQNGALGFKFGLDWPRQVYGRVVEELSEQGAEAVAFDVQFAELRPDHPLVQMADRRYIESDVLFATDCRLAGNVILAATPDLIPPELFATNALAIGDITTEKDPDGVLRRVRAFRIYRQWHPLFLKAATDYSLDLTRAKFIRGKIILPQTGTTNVVEVPVDAENNFDRRDFVGDKIPPGLPPKARAFADERVWHMGVVLAAQELKLDLAHADVDLPNGRITLRGSNGLVRVIPVDADGYFYVDWRLKPTDPHITGALIESLLWTQRYVPRQTGGGWLDGAGK